ncbi:MAG: family 20 glycosylhydrolase [Lewinellaceae bacterium]|nr:family 20 glycosylhydrolase [Lewinellaceae bacterium]
MRWKPPGNCSLIRKGLTGAAILPSTLKIIPALPGGYAPGCLPPLHAGGIHQKYIDYLTFHKLNTFHWHLIDGIGWRMEVKSTPELTDWGAWRVVKEKWMPWQDFEVWKPGEERPATAAFTPRKRSKRWWYTPAIATLR